jgi:DnaK suppressor protein
VKKPLKTSSKTTVKKTSSPASVKATAKAKPAAAVKKLSKPAPAKKTASKPVPKSAAKPVPKPASKPVTKPATKPASKPDAKAVVKKEAAKPLKSVAKPVVKPVAKAPAKPVSQAKVAPKSATKAAPKVAPKAPPKVVAKAAPKAAPISTTKPTAKPITKPTAKPADKAPAVAKPASKPAKAEKPVKSEKPAKPAKPPKADKTPAVLAAPVAAAPVVSGDVPARAVRPSARLAQITVPSMAQSVASTAAKASYLQNMPTQVLTPPPFVAVKKDPKLANNWKTKKPDQLTDAEVMAMSDNDYMNDAQLAYFRLKLVQLKQGILANAGETTEHLREDTVVVPDPADRATIEEEHALELRTRDRERKLLKKIEQSIQRIDAGDYGYCDETGEPIGVGRLLARPTANLSLEAQQRRELKQKMFGD